VAFVLLIISQSNVVSEISPGACIPQKGPRNHSRDAGSIPGAESTV
jgi:hypothetical protein